MFNNFTNIKKYCECIITECSIKSFKNKTASECKKENPRCCTCYPCPQIMPLCYLSSPYITVVIHHEQHIHQKTVKKVSGQIAEGAILKAVKLPIVVRLLSSQLQHRDIRTLTIAQVSGSPAYNGVRAAPFPFLNYSSYTRVMQIPKDHLLTDV